METKGLFKRIAAITMAALTIVTSSGVDVNLLTANASEATEQQADSSKKNTEATEGDSEKISFESDALKKAVQEAGFSIDTSTGKVVAGAIRYDGKLLTLGTDYKATAKKVDEKKVDSKTNYIYDVTVEGINNYTGRAVKEGVVAQKSELKSASTKVAAKKKTSKAKVKKASLDTSWTVEAVTSNATTKVIDSSSALAADKATKRNMYGWSIEFKNATLVEETNADGTSAYRVTYFDHNDGKLFTTPKIEVKYTATKKNGSTKEFTLDEDDVIGGAWRFEHNGTGTSYGDTSGKLTIETTDDWQKEVNEFLGKNGDDDKNSKMGGITVLYATWLSIMQNTRYSFSLRENQNSTPHPVSFTTTSGTATPAFDYTGKTIKPEVWLTTSDDGGNTVEKIADSDVSYGSDNSTETADYYTLTATMPSRLHREQVKISYAIGAKSITSDMVGNLIKPLTYNGRSQSDGVDFDIKGLTKGVDYNVDVDDATNAGKHSAKITGIGNYEGECTKEFTISPLELNNTTDKSKDAYVEIDLDAQTYDGNVKEPKPTIKVTLAGANNGKPITLTLKEGTDYKTLTSSSYTNNKSKGTASVKIEFIGNYSGTINKDFTISDGDVSAKGNKVQLYRDGKWIDAGTLTRTGADGKALEASATETLVASSDAFVYFSPVNTDRPRIRIITGDNTTLTQDTDFEAKEPQTTAKRSDGTTTKTWSKDFASTWTMEVAGKDNFDSSKKFILQFSMHQLPLSDSHIQIRKTNMNTVAPTADVYYVADNGTEAKLTQKTSGQTGDYTVSRSAATTAGKTTVTIQADPKSEKYTGSTTTDASYGYDLSKASTNDGINDGDLRITYFDPFTGKRLKDQNNTMPYYGTDNDGKVIGPHVIIEKYNEGNTKTPYTLIGENNYKVITSGSPNRTDNNGNEYYTLTIESDSENGGMLYGTLSGTPTSYTIERQSLNNAYDASSNTGGTIDVKPDNNSLTSYTDFDTVNSEVKLYVKPHNAGKVILVTDSNSSLTQSYKDQTDSGLESAKGRATYYWTAPDPWSDAKDRDNNDGILLTTSAYNGTKLGLTETGFSIRSQELVDKTVIAHGSGHFTGQYKIELDKVDIGKSADIEVSPVPDKTYDWTGQPIFPEVGLFQISADNIVTAQNFYIIYYNDKTHKRYVLSTDENGTYTGNFGANGDDDNKQTQNITENGFGIGKDAVQSDPTAENSEVQKNYAKEFVEEGSYSVYITMKPAGTRNNGSTSGQSDKVNITKLYGTTYKTSKVCHYTIKKKDVSSRITAKFDKSSVTFDGTENSSNYLPQLKSGSTNKGPKLSVTDNQNSKKILVQKTVSGAAATTYDYELDYDEDNEYFKYPGKKAVTVTGNGEYSGTTSASYTLTGDLSKLNNDKYFRVTGLEGFTMDADHTERKTIYTQAGGGFKTADGNDFSLDNIHIYVAGTDHELGSDEISFSQRDIKTEGKYDIKISSVSGAIYKGSYTIEIDVKESRSNLVWNQNGSDSIELPYKDGGYTLGDSELTLKSTFSENTVKLNHVIQKSDGTVDQSTGDTVTITPNDPRSNSEDKASVRPTFIEPGTYSITISGPPQANQSKTLYLTIKYDLSQATIDYKITQPYLYSGADPYAEKGFAETVEVYIPDKKEPLKVNDDYTISRDQISNGYSASGTYKVTLGPGTNGKFFSTTPSFSYEIVAANENSKLTAPDLRESLTTLTYDGTEKNIPESDLSGQVKYDGIATPLKYGTDYDITYPDGNINAGENLRYTIVGKGNYEGATTTNYFTIKPFDLKKAKEVKVTDKQYYAGATTDVTPKKLTVTIDGSSASPLTIEQGTDYTVDVVSGTKQVSKDNTKAKINVTGTGNYTGTLPLEYIIEKLSIADADINVTPTLPYTRNYYTDPRQYVKASIPGVGIDLIYGEDFTVKITRIADGDKKSVNQAIAPVNKLIDAGDYEVVLVANPNSSLVANGEASARRLHIEPMDISNQAADFRVDNPEWDGTEKTPAVYRGNTKIDSSWLSYSGDRTNACGTLVDMRAIDSGYSESSLPTVTVTGHGNYKGTLPLHFKIGHPFSEAAVSANGGRITYDGDSHKNLSFTVTSSNTNINTSLVKYEVIYPDDMTNAGDKKVTLKATSGAYYGTKTVTVSIYPVAGSVWTAEFTSLQQDSSGMYYTTYQGAPVVPDVKAYSLRAGGIRTEIPLKNTEITYANNTAAGTASVTIKPQNYEGTKVLYFKILGVDISQDNNVYIAFSDGINRRKYTGSAITPKLTVTYAGSQGTVNLTQDRDYSLTYENNTNAGAANVKVTGIGNYSGTRDLPFTIYADLNDKTSTFTIPKQMYTGQPITELSGATIKAGGNDLKLGTDYTLSITSTDSFRTKGTAIFTAQGKYYEGTRTVQFDIGNDASMYNVLGVAATYVYDRQAHKPVPVITDKEGTVYPTDSVTYSSTSDGDTCVNAGYVRMQIVITSHGQSVTIPYNYQIQARDINTASMTPIADVDYNGKAHTPTIRITDGTHLLTGSPTSSDGSADFTYTYYNNVQPGTATVTINGINNYTGIANLYFSINVKEAPQMKVTAMPSGRLKVSWNKVSGVSGYRIFYAPQNGSQKQVNIGSSKKTTYLTGLTRGVLYTVGLQSYVRANGQNGYSSASVQQIATSTTQPKITSAKSTGKGKIKLTWKKVSNATAYMVYRKTSGSKKWTRVKTTKSTSFTNTGLKSGRKYTYKVISYKQSGVKRSFSKYSKGKTVRAK